MKRIFYVIFSLVILQMQAFSLDVVYPTKSYVKINAPATFFVGSVNPQDKLFINDREIDVHKTGAFAQAVKLQQGQNEFKLISGEVIKTYIVERQITSGSYVSPAYTEFICPKTMEVIKNNTPIRSTAIQSGINRISHFQKGIQLKAIGEMGDMYKIQLASNSFAWVAKSNVERKYNYYEKAFLYDYNEKETDEEYIYEFALSKLTPYSITEGDVMTLKIYNVGANIDNTAEFKITLNQRLMGYDLRYKGDTLVLRIKKEPKITRSKPLKNIKIVIDAGHGGRELGAVGCCRNYEKDYNLSIIKYLEQELDKMGAKVYLTRASDRYVSLNDRVKFTNDKNAQIFVSVHANSLPDAIDPKTRRGSSVFYYYDEAKPLSDAIMNAVDKNMNVNNEGVKQASFAVVRNTSAVSVLVETAYVINPDDNEMLMNDEFRKQYASAIAEGIKNYVWVEKTRISWFAKREKATMTKIG